MDTTDFEAEIRALMAKAKTYADREEDDRERSRALRKAAGFLEMAAGAAAGFASFEPEDPSEAEDFDDDEYDDGGEEDDAFGGDGIFDGEDDFDDDDDGDEDFAPVDSDNRGSGGVEVEDEDDEFDEVFRDPLGGGDMFGEGDEEDPIES